MIIWRRGQVLALKRSWHGAQELSVVLSTGDIISALSYPSMVGSLNVDDEVLLNTAALERGLGTGGYGFVVASLSAELTEMSVVQSAAASGPSGADSAHQEAPKDETTEEPSAGPQGHLVKARYTPLQSMVMSVDEQDSAHHQVLRDADSIDGMVVVVADLHSALPAIIAGVRTAFGRAQSRAPRIAYIMTDGGALPIWFSRNAAQLRESGWIDTTITCGQAFGGDLESVTLHTALLAAKRVVQADVTVVIQGPGNLGTDTKWGFSGVAVGDAINAIGALGGRAVATLRMSQADSRDRHLGLSHHSVTAYGRVALVQADLVLPPRPTLVPPWWESNVSDRLAPLVSPCGRHRLIHIDEPDFGAMLAQSPVRLSTMGRTVSEDELSFIAAAAAGYWAGTCAANPAESTQ